MSGSCSRQSTFETHPSNGRERERERGREREGEWDRTGRGRMKQWNRERKSRLQCSVYLLIHNNTCDYQWQQTNNYKERLDFTDSADLQTV